MQERNLEELAKEIEEAKELGDFYEKEFKEKKNVAAETRCCFSRIKQYSLLVKKTDIELDNLLSKFDVQSGSAVKLFLARWGYYKKSINKLKERRKEYSSKLKEYEEKYSNPIKVGEFKIVNSNI